MPDNEGSDRELPDLQWSQFAQADLLAIIDYISDHNPDAAQQLKEDIEAKAAKLPSYPKLYRVGRVPGTREMVIWGNYIVVYTEDALAVRILQHSSGRLNRSKKREDRDPSHQRSIHNHLQPPLATRLNAGIDAVDVAQESGGDDLFGRA